jgi:hypothetical protein
VPISTERTASAADGALSAQSSFAVSVALSNAYITFEQTSTSTAEAGSLNDLSGTTEVVPFPKAFQELSRKLSELP